MTSLPDLSEVAAAPNPLIINSESLLSQELTTNDEPLLKQDIESKTEETKPCISEEQLYLSNKSFVIFFSQKYISILYALFYYIFNLK